MSELNCKYENEIQEGIINLFCNTSGNRAVTATSMQIMGTAPKLVSSKEFTTGAAIFRPQSPIGVLASKSGGRAPAFR